MRLSIAGVQSKTSLLIKNDKKYLPNFHNPSTHILKFDSKNVDNVLVNEYFITKLAQSLGLNVSNMQLKKIGQMSYLEIKRFDRSNDGMRINQEDFCQILSIRPASKYQNEGGPSFRKIVDFVRNNFTNSSKDIVLLSKILVYNFLVGNCDYHGKIFQLPIKTLLN